jgi:hypothetical protein
MTKKKRGEIEGGKESKCSDSRVNRNGQEGKWLRKEGIERRRRKMLR